MEKSINVYIYPKRISIKTDTFSFFERLVIGIKIIISFWGINIDFNNYKLNEATADNSGFKKDRNP